MGESCLQVMLPIFELEELAQCSHRIPSPLYSPLSFLSVVCFHKSQNTCQGEEV